MTLHIIVSGRVQGVWFRGSTLEEAQKLGLTGTVANLSDGSVEIFASGDKKALEAFVGWCHQGPQLAKVDSVLIDEVAHREFTDFCILRR